MRLALQRDREVDELSHRHDGVLYDPERGDLTMCNEGSGKTLILQLSSGYPGVGMKGVDIVAVEGDERSLEWWNVSILFCCALHPCVLVW